MTRYTMQYTDIPKTLFDKFVQGKFIDKEKCERMDVSERELEVEINVKNQNQNLGRFTKESKNINEIFKFTCQRYHSYITQIIEFLKNKETQIFASGRAAENPGKGT